MNRERRRAEAACAANKKRKNGIQSLLKKVFATDSDKKTKSEADNGSIEEFCGSSLCPSSLSSFWAKRMSNPIPSNLKSEAKKAAKILRDFTEISSRNGPDRLIPAHVIAKAQGLAIISVVKAGFMITARGGSGIVIARLADRRWSAPSAIGIAGLGGGFEIGVEVSDLVIILNHRRAVDAFTKGGNLTLGGNCTVAVGPRGRNLEADVAIRSTTAVFTYCRSRGLFAGISLEGSGLIERKETNRKYDRQPTFIRNVAHVDMNMVIEYGSSCVAQRFYMREIRASAILNGDVDPPPECYDLYHILDAYTEAYTTDWTSKNMSTKSAPSRPPAPVQRPASTYQQRPAPYQQPPAPYQQPPAPYQQPPASYQQQTTSYQYQTNSYQQQTSSYQQPPGSAPKSSLYPSVSVYKSETSDRASWMGGASGQLVVTATHLFAGEQPGDLSFAAGDRITVITKTDSEYDWWEGQLADGRVGIFPANFVAL
ncbi:SH3 domain-containing YSC84-like protein 1 [Liparis tanakae]|uniref:SH3 domain-containing YSC84-like protein 1 n=1 Tax=Liparis tanakae TaxID=230148 RepID=A0A4Z2F2H0_9TELE|nr:SH3 domain-containing YSC84-like protein 1 [Liparis tanakae]